MMGSLMRKQMWLVKHFNNDQIRYTNSLSVVIWSSMLGSVHSWQDALSWPKPKRSRRTPGYWRKTGQTKEFRMFSRNVS